MYKEGEDDEKLKLQAMSRTPNRRHKHSSILNGNGTDELP